MTNDHVTRARPVLDLLDMLCVRSTGSAFYVEVLAMRIGIPAPSMTPEQHDLKISHWFSNIVSKTAHRESNSLSAVYSGSQTLNSSGCASLMRNISIMSWFEHNIEFCTAGDISLKQGCARLIFSG